MGCCGIIHHLKYATKLRIFYEKIIVCALQFSFYWQKTSFFLLYDNKRVHTESNGKALPPVCRCMVVGVAVQCRCGGNAVLRLWGCSGACAGELWGSAANGLCGNVESG